MQTIKQYLHGPLKKFYSSEKQTPFKTHSISARKLKTSPHYLGLADIKVIKDLTSKIKQFIGC